LITSGRREKISLSWGFFRLGPPRARWIVGADEKVVKVPREKGRKVIASNRRARHDYAILDTFEAGIALTGTEVKSLRAGRASLVDAYAQEKDGEIFLYGMHVPEYAQGTWTNHEPRRTRKLLLNRFEIDRLIGKTRETGLTLVPLSLYFSDGWAKVELALARGKKSYDKRQDLARRDADREITRALGRRGKGME
jgi:SsrA-binding protein